VIFAHVNIICVKSAQITEAQFAVATKFYKVTPSICVAVLAPGILRWLLDFLQKSVHTWFCNILMMTSIL